MDQGIKTDFNCVFSGAKYRFRIYPRGNPHIPPGEKENHLQKCRLGKGYVSSLEGRPQKLWAGSRLVILCCLCSSNGPNTTHPPSRGPLEVPERGRKTVLPTLRGAHPARRFLKRFKGTLLCLEVVFVNEDRYRNTWWSISYRVVGVQVRMISGFVCSTVYTLHLLYSFFTTRL